ncbi:DUF1501 domain-containing protein [Bythopirellula polymerisocia]|nr:DUF1501 domain-containing protein [Bythopirellula polymerisocia]
MFEFNTKKAQPSTRRRFMEQTARQLLGVSFLPLMAPQALAASSKAKGKATQVIYLFMDGAMSQLDTFDPKPGSDVQGDTKTIDTNVAGVKFGQHLPELAKMMDQLVLVRSLSTQTGDHDGGKYLMRTGYKSIASTRHPSLGAWIQKLAGKGNEILPGSVVIGGGSGHPAAGYLGAQYAPVPIADARRGVENTKPPKYLSVEQFDNRMDLAQRFDRAFQNKYRTAQVSGYADLYREAISLMRSDELAVFDVNLEPENVRQAYGNDGFALGCLLARRLVQHGVRFVEVNLGGWDMHNDLFRNMAGRAQLLDKTVSTLLKDLKSNGLLDETLVVIGTEFGRTPDINQNAGRDHHPGAFTCVLAGGGVIGGNVYGLTDGQARKVEEDPVSVQDFNSTIAYAMGLDPSEEIYSPDKRLFTLGHGGEPLVKLFG